MKAMMGTKTTRAMRMARMLLSEQGNKSLIGLNPIRQPGAGETYNGSPAPVTS
jgi:hypothetical protein